MTKVRTLRRFQFPSNKYVNMKYELATPTRTLSCTRRAGGYLKQKLNSVRALRFWRSNDTVLFSRTCSDFNHKLCQDKMKTHFALLGMLLLAVGLVYTFPIRPEHTPFELFTVIHLEEPCVRQGGICMRVEDCPSGNLVQVRNVLCPVQSQYGVECCYI